MMTKNRKPTPFTVLLVAGAIAATPVVADTYTVTTPYPDGPGSLSDAIDKANNRAGRDTIEFDIDPNAAWEDITNNPGDFELVPNSKVIHIFSDTTSEVCWEITDEVTIDGTTQPGYNGYPIITCQARLVDGTFRNFTGDFGATIFNVRGADAAGTVIKGIQMNKYTSTAIDIWDSADGCKVEYCYVGFVVDGDEFPNFYFEDEVTDPENTYGIMASARDVVIRQNVISGCGTGIKLGFDDNTAYPGIEVKDNRIGTSMGGFIFRNPVGDTEPGNRGPGIRVMEGVMNVCHIGPGNTISNNYSGVEILHPTNQGIICFRNQLGTDDTGDAPIGNMNDGVLIGNGANFCAVGGPFGGNTISGNGMGVWLGGRGNGPVTTIYVQNNFIGCNPSRSAVVGNQQTGIQIDNSSGNAIEYNMIVGQLGNAILLSNSPTNLVSGNALGLTDGGLQAANNGYGIFFLNGSNFNYIGGYFAPKPFNYIGPNNLGAFGSQGSGGNIPGLDF